MRARSCFHCFCDIRGDQRQLFCQGMVRLCHTQLGSDPTTFKWAVLHRSAWDVCKRQAKFSLYYLSFCDRKNNTQQKFISCFDIAVINDNFLRHTGVSRIPHFLSLLLIIEKLRYIAFFTMGRNSQVSKQCMDYAMSMSKRGVQCCTARLHCFIRSHCSPCCSGGNYKYDPSIWHRPLLLHPGWTVLAEAVSCAGTYSLFIPTCGKGKEDESDVIYLHSWQCWTPISSWW